MSDTQGQRRARATTGQVGDSPHVLQLRQRRFDVAQKVTALRKRVRDCDPKHSRALDVLVEGLRRAEGELAAIAAALAGPSAEVVALRPTPEPDPVAVRTAKQEARQRLYHLLVVLETVPVSCTTAARTLRRGIKRELRALDTLRATTTESTRRTSP